MKTDCLSPSLVLSPLLFSTDIPNWANLKRKKNAIFLFFLIGTINISSQVYAIAQLLHRSSYQKYLKDLIEIKRKKNSWGGEKFIVYYIVTVMMYTLINAICCVSASKFHSTFPPSKLEKYYTAIGWRP